jgi:hypothetical protein
MKNKLALSSRSGESNEDTFCPSSSILAMERKGNQDLEIMNPTREQVCSIRSISFKQVL